MLVSLRQLLKRLKFVRIFCCYFDPKYFQSFLCCLFIGLISWKKAQAQSWRAHGRMAPGRMTPINF